MLWELFKDLIPKIALLCCILVLANRSGQTIYLYVKQKCSPFRCEFFKILLIEIDESKGISQ